MSNFVRVRSSGMWTLNSTWLPAEVEEWDSRWPKVPNFTDGGTWSSLTPVILGGAGFQTSHFEATNVDVFQVDGVVTFNNASEVFYAASVAVSVSAGAWTFDDESLVIFDGSSGLQFTDNSVLSFLTSTQLTMGTGSTLAMLGTASLTMASTATMSLAGQITVTSTGGITLNTGATLVAGSMQLDSTGISHPGGSWATATGLLTLTKHLVLSGADAGIVERTADLPNADANMDCSIDAYRVRQVLTAERFYTLDKTSPVPVEGQTMCVTHHNNGVADGTSHASFQRESGTLIAQFKAVAGNPSCWCEFIFRSGDWHVKAFGTDVAGSLAITMPAATY